MAVQHNRPSRRGGPRPRLWIDPNPCSSSTTSASPSSISADLNTSLAPSSSEVTDAATPTSSAELFYVLCIYDYDAEDSDQLSFRKNDILDVVKKEDTGWWAAIRPDDNRVGWIPCAFVEPISDALADKLRSSGGNVQIYQDDADMLHGSPGEQLTDPFAVPTEGLGEHRGYDWMPLVNGDKVPIMQLGVEPSPPGIANMFSPLVPPHEGIDGNFLEIESTLSPTDSVTSLRPPEQVQSPLEVHEQVITLPPASVEERSLPATPRTPSRRRSLSYPSPDAPPSEHQRSRSESSKPAKMRHLRRRPLLIDDPPSLDRLTTLLEAPNLEEIEQIISSPVVVESFDAYKRTRSDKVKQITGDDKAQAFHDARLAQNNCYLRPLCGEHEIHVLLDGTVTAGTLRALVERLTVDCGKSTQETRYRQAFLMTYKSFATAEEVLDLLVAQYHLNLPSALTPKELDQWKEKKLKPTRRRVLTVLQVWIDGCSLLQDDHYLARRIVDFVSSINAPPLASMAHSILRSLERYISGIPPTPASAVTIRHKKGKGSKTELIRMDPLSIAEHLTMHVQRIYTRIRPQECLNWARSQRGSGVKHIVAFNVVHERLGAWVKMSVLNLEGLGKRAETMDLWVKVAEKCKALHNYAAMHAIVSALSNPLINRLHFTWAHASRRTQLEQLAQYHDPSGELTAYRTMQRSAEGPCLPHIGMYLADLQLVHEQHTDNVLVSPSASPLGTTVSLINFVKRELWWEAMDAMLRHQAKPYAFAEDASILVCVEAGMAAAADRDQGSFWMKSQEIQQAELQHADIRKGLELAGF